MKQNIYIYIYNFHQYETIKSFDDSIYTRKSNMVEAEEDRSNISKNIVEFNDKSRPTSKEDKNKKRDTYESAYALYEGQELTLNAFRKRIFAIKATESKGLKILTPEQMLQRLPMALTQVKAGDTSENVLNEIRQIIPSWYRAKEITEKVYNNIMNSVKV